MDIKENIDDTRIEYRQAAKEDAELLIKIYNASCFFRLYDCYCNSGRVSTFVSINSTLSKIRGLKVPVTPTAMFFSLLT